MRHKEYIIPKVDIETDCIEGEKVWRCQKNGRRPLGILYSSPNRYAKRGGRRTGHRNNIRKNGSGTITAGTTSQIKIARLGYTEGCS